MKNFYQKKWFLILMFFIFPIYNLIFLIKSNINKILKLVLSFLLCIWILFILIIWNCIFTVSSQPSLNKNNQGVTKKAVISQQKTIINSVHTTKNINTNSHITPDSHNSSNLNTSVKPSNNTTFSNTRIIKNIDHNWKDADLHINPNSASKVLEKLPGGDKVTLNQYGYYWSKITTPDGTTGWVYTNYIENN